MELWLYKTTKVENSTYQPVEVVAKINDFYIIHNTDLISPAIQLNGWASSNSQDELYIDSNYCWVSNLNRYYFINSVSYSEDGFIILHCQIDTLATYKNDILRSIQFVERSASKYNGDIVDTLYRTKGNPQKITYGYQQPFKVEKDMNKCFFICGLIDDNTRGKSAVSYYVMAFLAVRMMIAKLQSDYPEEFNENPMQFIKSLQFIPMGITTLYNLISEDYLWPHLNDPIYIRNGNNIGAGIELSNYVNKLYIDIPLKSHPQSNRGIYLNQEPFTELFMNLPPFGAIKIPASYLMNASTMRLWQYLDLTSGMLTIEIYDTASGILVHRGSVQLGIELPLEQVVTNKIGQGMNVLSGVGSLLSGNLGGVMGSIANSVDLKYPKSSSMGGMGNFNDLEGDYSINYIFNLLTDEDNDHLGRPLCERVRLDTLKGYTKVSNAKIEINATLQEKQQLKALLENGFYIE